MADDTIPPAGGTRPPGAATDVRTFLIADMRGYTRFTQERGDEAASALAAAFAQMVGTVLPEFDGDLVELRGDEALCVFGSARQAIRAAVALQARLQASPTDGGRFPLGVGVGLDAGEAVPTAGGYRGGALNLAARLCASARPGEVLASEGVIHLARHVDGIRFEPRRPIRLKGFDEPVRLVAVLPESPPSVVSADERVRGWCARRRVRLALAAAGVVVVGALAVFIRTTVGTGGSASAVRIEPSSLVELDPKDGSVIGDVIMPAPPSGVVDGPGGLWVTSASARLVTTFDPASRSLHTFHLGVTPTGMAATPSGVFISAGLAGSVIELRRHSGPPVLQTARIAQCCSGPTTITTGLDIPVVAGAHGAERLDPATLTVAQTLHTGPAASAMAVDNGQIWVADGWNTVFAVAAGSGRVVRRVSLAANGPAEPSQLAYGSGELWVMTPGWRSVTLVNTSSGRIEKQIGTRGIPTMIAYADGAFWITASDGTITKISANSERVAFRKKLQGRPVGVAADDGRIWVAVQPSRATATQHGTILFDDSGDIWTIRADSTHRRRLTNGSASGDQSLCPSWSPDGSQIAFSSSRGQRGLFYNLFIMNADGTGVVQVTHDAPRWDICPIWSPDGKTLAFYRVHTTPTGATEGGNTYSIDLATRRLRQLTSTWSPANPTLLDWPHSWSPDGRRLLVTSTRGRAGEGAGQIYVVPATGHGRQPRLRSDPGNDDNPQWSPNGTRILFFGQIQRPAIDLTNPSGQGFRELLATPWATDFAQPAWSPDGSAIAVAGTFPVPTNLYVANADGTGLVRITNDDAAGDPTWRPTR